MKKNNYIDYILSILGFLVITLIIWNRFLRTRLPRDIMAFQVDIYIYYIIPFIIIVLLLTIFYYLKIIKERRNINPGIIGVLCYKIFIRYRTIFEPIIKKASFFARSPKIFYDTIIWKHLYNHMNIAHLVEVPFHGIYTFICKFVEKKRKIILFCIYFTFATMPKLFVLTMFLKNIFIDNYLFGFYNCLYLLGIPLFYNALLYIVNDLSEKNLYYINSHIKFESYNDEYDQVRFKDEMPPMEDAVDIVKEKYNKSLLDWFVLAYNIYTDIKDLIDTLLAIQEKYKPYIMILISSLYIVGWVYILFYPFF